MSAETSALFEEYLNQFNISMRGGAGDQTVVMDKNFHFVLNGQPPACGELHSLEEAQAMFNGDVFAGMESGDPDYGYYVDEFIGEGNRMAAVLRSRGETKRGMPYSNTYFFVFEARDGKLIEVIEDTDSSHAAQTIFDLKMVPA